MKIRGIMEKSVSTAGIMISVSHNPVKDNEIKIFWEITR